jgi:hypothetical protein
MTKKLAFEIVLFLVGTGLDLVTVMPNTLYWVTIPSSILFLGLCLWIGISSWKAQTRPARTLSVLLMLLCCFQLVDLILRRLPYLLVPGRS